MSSNKIKILRSTMGDGKFLEKGKEYALKAATARLLCKIGKAIDPSVEQETSAEKEDVSFESVEEMQAEIDSLEQKLEKAQKSKAKDADKKVEKLEEQIQALEDKIAEA